MPCTTPTSLLFTRPSLYHSRWYLTFFCNPASDFVSLTLRILATVRYLCEILCQRDLVWGFLHDWTEAVRFWDESQRYSASLITYIWKALNTSPAGCWQASRWPLGRVNLRFPQYSHTLLSSFSPLGTALLGGEAVSPVHTSEVMFQLLRDKTSTWNIFDSWRETWPLPFVYSDPIVYLHRPGLTDTSRAVLIGLSPPLPACQSLRLQSSSSWPWDPLGFSDFLSCLCLSAHLFFVALQDGPEPASSPRNQPPPLLPPLFLL